MWVPLCSLLGYFVHLSMSTVKRHSGAGLVFVSNFLFHQRMESWDVWKQRNEKKIKNNLFLLRNKQMCYPTVQLWYTLHEITTLEIIHVIPGRTGTSHCELLMHRETPYV